MTDLLGIGERPSLARRVLELAGEVGRYGPRSVPADLRREHLLACATLLFTEEGFEGTSMNDVAAMAGVSKPVLYDAFGSKEDLFGAVMDETHQELLQRVAAAMEAEPDPGRYVFATSRAYFEFVQERRAAWLNLLRSGPGLVGEWMEVLQRRHASFLGGLISGNLDRAGIPYDPRRVEGVTEMLVGAVVALAGWWVEQDGVSVEEAAELYATAMEPSIRAALPIP